MFPPLSAPGPGCSGCELLQRVHDVQSRAGHLPHGPEEAGGRRPQHGPLHEGLPGETAHHAAGAVRLREGAEMFHFMFPLLPQDLFKEAMSCVLYLFVYVRGLLRQRELLVPTENTVPEVPTARSERVLLSL